MKCKQKDPMSMDAIFTNAKSRETGHYFKCEICDRRKKYVDWLILYFIITDKPIIFLNIFQIAQEEK